jgi:hypothetical protein
MVDVRFEGRLRSIQVLWLGSLDVFLFDHHTARGRNSYLFNVELLLGGLADFARRAVIVGVQHFDLALWDWPWYWFGHRLLLGLQGLLTSLPLSGLAGPLGHDRLGPLLLESILKLLLLSAKVLM